MTKKERLFWIDKIQTTIKDKDYIKYLNIVLDLEQWENNNKAFSEMEYDSLNSLTDKFRFWNKDLSSKIRKQYVNNAFTIFRYRFAVMAGCYNVQENSVTD